MDVYGLSAPDFFRIDDLLDFSNEEIFSSTTTTDSDIIQQQHQHQHHYHLPLSENTSACGGHFDSPNPNHSNIDFTDDLCVPNDDVAELEWLSKFVDDSFHDFPKNELYGTVSFRPETSFHGRSRTKRSRAPFTNNSWTSSPESDTPIFGKSDTNSTKKRDNSSCSSLLNGDRSSSPSVARKCSHCASEKTPQWRTGPLGPKTLCNACGVRYKSGRLVPEYRPAASPTFVLTQHSNSHRKVMELRRQKELQQQQQEQPLHHHPQHDFKVY
ncbi:hypothetical protein F0562_019081 [Nyssa sinensis]|uniref:GATA transcription factor n=1 Tax=Nyssa sinensis TaxID=561372 RepID=A0A5J4ZDX0_9ASTE|nr:hypothetical protein F0562_019081 [Nyssa sinensis]